MFENLSTKLGKVFDGLRRHGAITEKDINEALREVRIALLEADVALPVVKDLISTVSESALGEEVLKSVTPVQVVIKIVHDHLIDLLGKESTGIDLSAVPPVPLLLIGLQGSGKTTTTAKIASLLSTKQKKKVLMASLDIYRPAAQQQLQILGEQIGISTLPIVEGQIPVDIARRAMDSAKLRNLDVILFDTAGRLTIDEGMMSEAKALKKSIKPLETLLVADSLTGQDAVKTAKIFHDQLGLTGIVLTRIDGDGRGGAALSMRAATGCPIKFLGTGEKIEELEIFHPDRIASRILGMGDVVTLVEKATEVADSNKSLLLEKKLQKGTFDLDDYSEQLKQMKKMGGMNSLVSLLPGINKVKKQISNSNIDENVFIQHQAIISSMTIQERRKSKILNGSRRRRIAAGSGTTIQEVNRMLKQHRQMADMAKKMGKLGKSGQKKALQGLTGLPKGH